MHSGKHSILGSNNGGDSGWKEPPHEGWIMRIPDGGNSRCKGSGTQMSSVRLRALGDSGQ